MAAISGIFMMDELKDGVTRLLHQPVRPDLSLGVLKLSLLLKTLWHSV